MISCQKTLSIQDLDLEDQTFSINFMPDCSSLRSSIREVGLIQPVLLREKPPGYQVVCGFRRIAVLQELGITEVASIIVSGEADLRLFSWALHDNRATRGFNTVETALALDRLMHRFTIDPAAVITAYLPFFSLEPNEKVLKTYLDLARMEEEIQRYVLEENVSRTNIRRLASMTVEDRRATLALVSSLKLGENSLRETLTFLEEISRREGQPIARICGHSELQSVLGQKELTPSQKTDRVKGILTNLRYPRLHGLEEAFEHRRKALDLGSHVSLHHHPFFESKRMRMQFEFETLNEYESILVSLSLLPGKKEFKGLLEEV